MKDINLKFLFDQILCPGVEWILTVYMLHCSRKFQIGRQLLIWNLKIKTKTNILGTFSKIHATPGHWENSYLEISCTKQISDSLYLFYNALSQSMCKSNMELTPSHKLSKYTEGVRGQNISKIMFNPIWKQSWEATVYGEDFE